uniref:Mast cell expressed membrane protein 1 n=2 Tax=Canis lupus familiaris TaxID=9615 RepID=A0A8I3PUQ2_CANLF
MESEEIYTNQKVEMQAAFKDKKQRVPADKEGADNPDYENITLAFRNQDQPKGSHLPPKNQSKQPPARTHHTALGGAHVPTLSRLPSDSGQLPRCLHRVIMSLYMLLALSCIVLLVLVLMKNLEMSQELLALKRELWNVSVSVQECQEQQNQGWSTVRQLLVEAKRDISMVGRNAQLASEKVKTLTADISHIKSKLQEISKMLEKPKPCKLGLGGG